jgi:VIT1/CCC1 family predicted Fe2+/Mn2+ transporter
MTLAASWVLMENTVPPGIETDRGPAHSTGIDSRTAGVAPNPGTMVSVGERIRRDGGVMDAKTLHRLRQAQRAEITESRIYHRLAQSATSDHNREVLQRIGDDEKRHHDILARHTGVRGRPRRLVVWMYVMLARVFGVTFALRLMERGERNAQIGYSEFAHLDGVDVIAAEEEQHEQRLIGLLDDQRLAYAGSVVLGLNDALVELTGALAGLSLALAETRIVAAAGLVTGIAASMSMAASEYLASRHGRESGENALTAAIYTGGAYIVAVGLLVLPFLLLDRILAALVCTLGVAVTIIAAFNWYLAIARNHRFWPRFAEMALISLGVAAVSFGIGWVVRHLFALDV